MAVKPILRIGDPRLLAVSAPVTEFGTPSLLALIAEFSVGLMDRQRLEPRRNAYDAFVSLPLQGPSLVYRYLFDRASFYKHGS